MTFLEYLQRRRSSMNRCRSDHFSPFLRRRVRCEMGGRHIGPHRYRTFDEVVSWPVLKRS